MEWKLAEAKNRFSELVNKALSDGPQKVSRRGERVVVISEHDYQNLTGKKQNFIEFLLDHEIDLEGMDLQRDKTLSRETQL